MTRNMIKNTPYPNYYKDVIYIYIYNLDLLYILDLSCTSAIMCNHDTKIHRLKTFTSCAFLCVSDL